MTNDTKIILIKATVFELYHFLLKVGYSIANSKPIPFPSTGHQAEYREEMIRILKSPGNIKTRAEVSSDDAEPEPEEEIELAEDIPPAQLLLDDYCSSFAGSLKQAEWEVWTVHDLGLANKTPEEIADFAQANDMMLVVRDERIERAAEESGTRCVNITLSLITYITFILSEMAE